MEENQEEQINQPRSLNVIRAKKTVSRNFTVVTPLICAFCGGKTCKHENWQTHPNPAIKGLNSDWVTDNILATQRPSSRLIKEYDIIEQFKAKDIRAILNLQEPGEHPHCGDGINPRSGFSYNPEEFYEHEIYFFNFGWRDMTATSTDLILKILKQMSFILSNGEKIAVHCHAGRGRTGMIIAAWLIYNENMSAKDAIKLVKARRKESISKKSQEKVLLELEKELKNLRFVIYPSPKLSLEQLLSNQKKVLPLLTTSEEKYVPKIILVCLERLESLLVSGVCQAKQIINAFCSLSDSMSFQDKWDSKHEKILKSFKERVNQGRYESSDVDDPRYPAQMILDFLDSFTSPAIGQRFIEKVYEKLTGVSRFTDSMKEELVKEVNKKEFFLLEGFAKFLSVIAEADDQTSLDLQRLINRLCISLLAARHKYDKLFLKRDLIKLPGDEDRISKLRFFLQKWIEDFNKDLTESMITTGANKSSRLGRAEIFRRAKSKTILTKTIQKLRSGEYSEPIENNSRVGYTGKKAQLIKKNILEDDIRNNISDDEAPDPFQLAKVVSNAVKSGEISQIEPIKEDEEKSFNSDDIFPGPNKQSDSNRASLFKPLDMKKVLTRETKSKPNSERKTASTQYGQEQTPELLTTGLKNRNAIPQSVSSPKLNDLFLSVEELTEKDQEALLEKLLKMKASRKQNHGY